MEEDLLKEKEKLLKEKTVETMEKYSGGIINVKVAQVKLPDGKTSRREVVEHPGAAAVIAEHEQKIPLLLQYRYPTGEALLEIPAGKIDKGEAPEDCARREMLEETGYAVEGKLKLLTKFYTSPGFCDEVIYLYYADEIEKKSDLTGDSEENLHLLMLSREEILSMLKDNRIKDAKTIIGLQWLLNGGW